MFVLVVGKNRLKEMGGLKDIKVHTHIYIYIYTVYMYKGCRMRVEREREYGRNIEVKE